MRRFISLVLIFCILHTSTYAALAELAPLTPSQSSSPTTHPVSAPSAYKDPKFLGKLSVEPSNDPDTATVVMPEEQKPTEASQKQPYRRKHHPVMLGMCGVGLAITYILGGRAIWSALQPQAVATTDICPAHTSPDSVSHQEHLQRHTYGESYLEGELPNWLSNNVALMKELGELAHDLRHDDERTKESWLTAREHTYNALHNHGIATLKYPIVCDIKLGDGESPDTVTECRSASQRLRPPHRPPLPEGTDAQLWLFPIGKHDQFKPTSLDFIGRRASDDQRYPFLDISLDHNTVDHAARTSMRRQLLQAGNTQTLPEAIQATLNTRNDVRKLMATVAENMRQWNPATEEIKALNTLVKGIFEAHGYIMTGDVQCGFVLENGALKLSGCALMSTRRAARSFAAQQDTETVTFRQSLQNPVKFDAVDVEAQVLSPEAALPLVLHRAATPLHGELETLHNDQCRPDDRTKVEEVAATVNAALRIPNVAMSEDMACDVTVRNGVVHQVACHPAVAPDSAPCGTYNGTFAAEGRVWIKPDGVVVMSANRNWNITQTAELPRTPTLGFSKTPTVSRPHSVTLPHTMTPQQTGSESLPVVERPAAPANTTTRLYWANWATKPADSSVWVAEVNHTSGGLINPRLFVQGEPVSQPGGLHVDEKNGFMYWGLNSGRGIFATRLQTSPPRVYDNATLLSTIDTQEVASLFLEGDTLYWLRGAQLIWGTVDPTNPTSITNVQRPIDNSSTLEPNDLCPLSSPAGLYVNKGQKQLILSCQGGSKGPLMFKFDAGGRTITQRKAMSNAMPEVPQSSAIAPELGRVFTRSPGKLYGADIDLDIPAVSGFETLVSNTTMVKYYGGMSVVPNATDWMEQNSTSRLYWANYDSNTIYMADLDPRSGIARNVRLFIEDPALSNPRAIYVNETNSTLYWAGYWAGNGELKFANISALNPMLKDLASRTKVSKSTGTSVYNIAFDYTRNILLIQLGLSRLTYYVSLSDYYFSPEPLESQIRTITTPSVANDLELDLANGVIGMTFDNLRQKVYFLIKDPPYRLYSIDIERTAQFGWRYVNYTIIGNTTDTIGRLSAAWIEVSNKLIYLRPEAEKVLYSCGFNFAYTLFGGFKVVLNSSVLSRNGGGMYVSP